MGGPRRHVNVLDVETLWDAVRTDGALLYRRK